MNKKLDYIYRALHEQFWKETIWYKENPSQTATEVLIKIDEIDE